MYIVFSILLCVDFLYTIAFDKQFIFPNKIRSISRIFVFATKPENQ